MKKMLSMLAIAAIAVGCSKIDSESIDLDRSDLAIAFNPSLSLSAPKANISTTATRALIGAGQIGGSTSTEKLEALAPTADGGTFQVVAYHTGETTNEYLSAKLSSWDSNVGNPLFQKADAAGNGEQGNAGEGLTGTSYTATVDQTLYYWPLKKDEAYDFYAYFVKETGANLKIAAQTGSLLNYNYTMAATPGAQNDVLIADPILNQSKQSVAATAAKVLPVTFRHAMSMVQFVFASTVPTSYTFQKVVISDYSKGTFDITKAIDITGATSTGVIVDATSPKMDITNDLISSSNQIAAVKYIDQNASSYTAASRTTGSLKKSDGVTEASTYMTDLVNSSILVFPETATTGLKKTAKLTFAKGNSATDGIMNIDVDLKALTEGFLPGKVYQYVIKYDGKVIELGAPVVVDWTPEDAGEVEL